MLIMNAALVYRLEQRFHVLFVVRRPLFEMSSYVLLAVLLHDVCLINYVPISSVDRLYR